MDYPTYREARPLWRQTGEVETHQPTMSVAERLARARHDAVAPASQPPVTLQTARRLRSSMAPARREQAGAVPVQSSAPSPRPAPPRQRQSVTATILAALTAADRPMTYRELRDAMGDRSSVGAITGLLWKLRERGVLVQDVPRGPYRLPGVEPASPTATDKEPKMGKPKVRRNADRGPCRVPDGPSHVDQVTGLSRLVKQIRDERDALQAENTALRARIQAAQAALQEA